MAEETNKSLRIRTNVGENSDKFVTVLLDQDYDNFQILSLTLNEDNVYKLHNSDYGVVIGRVLANNGFGIPNAKISVFIATDGDADRTIKELYPYSTTMDKKDGVRYNLLPNKSVNDCHKAVGSFPNKTYLLDNDTIIEIFDTYYRYTTRTNNSGDYMIVGVPTGQHTLHMDLDLSDCGVLSQRPRDFVYKGYNVEQFENPNQFKSDNDLTSLSQIFTQDQAINVLPFWGDSSNEATIGITRADINVAFKFEPTCVFMGSAIIDEPSNGITRKCVATDEMGSMEKLATGEGTIEMIRKTMGGSVEEFQIKGTQLINADGIWCYQIPMNLDYMMTDEYGNMVPTDDPNKGIPTRARVRFRLSLQDTESNSDTYFRSKVLIPHNPNANEDYDYNFGSYTKDESYRDLFWNNVYTVKSYVPRIQKGTSWRNERFTGIKSVNYAGTNNPIPYNNMRVKMPIAFVLYCFIIKALIFILKICNVVIGSIYSIILRIADALANVEILGWHPLEGAANFFYELAAGFAYLTLSDGLCEDLEGWYFAPCFNGTVNAQLLTQTLNKQIEQGEGTSCLTSNTDYLYPCIDMTLAQEYKVIKFDFYNDWLNGVIYLPRWMKDVRYKKRKGEVIKKTRGCMSDTSIFSNTRRYIQMCSLAYSRSNDETYTRITNAIGCTKTNVEGAQRCHKADGRKDYKIFGKNGGLVYEGTTLADQKVYYLKPCEINSGSKITLFATDLVLLGSLNDCDLNGLPQTFEGLVSSTYKMPTNLALTNMDEVGYVYTNGDTVCKEAEIVNEGPTQGGNTFEGLQTAYEGTDNAITYGREDDAIPTTEAAGMAWNYIGPGQGSNSFNDVYYPGGHFLSIGCLSSDVNIKSCVNLQRVCELGAEISQRHEIVAGEDSDETEYFAYMVPNGLVSKDEIANGDVRTMFATMNRNRLLATTIDEKTGYPVYDFKYNKPTNFDGSLKDYVSTSANYNGKANVNDETSAIGLSDVQSYDSKESNFSYKRSLESTNKDYYMFRMGLNSLDENEQKSKFLYSVETLNGTGYVLPQFENSFYFYFGLHNGATALDEFRKQFYSKCNKDDESLVVPEIIYRGFDSGDTGELLISGGTLVLEVDNMTSPYNVIVDNIRTEGYDFSAVTTSEIVSFSNVPIGEYHIIVTDTNNMVAERVIDCMSNYVNMNLIGAVDFTETMRGKSKAEVIAKIKEDIGEYTTYGEGGCSFVNSNGHLIIGDNFKCTINGAQKTLDDSHILLITGKEGNTVYYINSANANISNLPKGNEGNKERLTFNDLYRYKDGDIIYSKMEDLPTGSNCKGYYVGENSGNCDYYVYINNNWEKYDAGIYHRIPLWDTFCAYNVYYGEKSNSGKWGWVPLGTFNFIGIDNEDLYMGCNLLSYYDILRYLRPNWWMYLEERGENGAFKGRFPSNNKNGLTEDQTVWLLKHFIYKQTTDGRRFDSKVYALNPNNEVKTSITYGQPEKDLIDANSGNTGEGLYLWDIGEAIPSLYQTQSTTYSDNYMGYNLSDEWVDRCTYNIKYPIENGDNYVQRQPFSKTSIREDNTGVVTNLVSGLTSNKDITLKINDYGYPTLTVNVGSGDSDFINEMISGQTYVLKITNSGETMLINACLSSFTQSEGSFYLLDDIKKLTDTEITEGKEETFTLNAVYKTFQYPVVSKPFMFKCSPFVWYDADAFSAQTSKKSFNLCETKNGITTILYNVVENKQRPTLYSFIANNSQIINGNRTMLNKNAQTNKYPLNDGVFSIAEVNEEPIEMEISATTIKYMSAITIDSKIEGKSKSNSISYLFKEGEYSGITSKDDFSSPYTFNLATCEGELNKLKPLNTIYYYIETLSEEEEEFGGKTVAWLYTGNSVYSDTLLSYGEENNIQYYVCKNSGITYGDILTSPVHNEKIDERTISDVKVKKANSTETVEKNVTFKGRTITYTANALLRNTKATENDKMFEVGTVNINICMEVFKYDDSSTYKYILFGDDSVYKTQHSWTMFISGDYLHPLKYNRLFNNEDSKMLLTREFEGIVDNGDCTKLTDYFNSWLTSMKEMNDSYMGDKNNKYGEGSTYQIEYFLPTITFDSMTLDSDIDKLISNSEKIDKPCIVLDNYSDYLTFNALYTTERNHYNPNNIKYDLNELTITSKLINKYGIFGVKSINNNRVIYPIINKIGMDSEVLFSTYMTGYNETEFPYNGFKMDAIQTGGTRIGGDGILKFRITAYISPSDGFINNVNELLIDFDAKDSDGFDFYVKRDCPPLKRSINGQKTTALVNWGNIFLSACGIDNNYKCVGISGAPFYCSVTTDGYAYNYLSKDTIFKTDELTTMEFEETDALPFEEFKKKIYFIPKTILLDDSDYEYKKHQMIFKNTGYGELFVEPNSIYVGKESVVLQVGDTEDVTVGLFYNSNYDIVSQGLNNGYNVFSPQTKVTITDNGDGGIKIHADNTGNITITIESIYNPNLSKDINISVI